MKSFLKKTLVLIASFVMIAYLSSCDYAEKKEYYRQKENYVEATGTLVHFTYNYERTRIFLGFSDTQPAFDDYTFKIVGKSVQYVTDAGIEDKLEIGARVTFIVAPKYFGDGYAMPIVAISVGDKLLLDFDTGYTHLMEWFDS